MSVWKWLGNVNIWYVLAFDVFTVIGIGIHMILT